MRKAVLLLLIFLVMLLAPLAVRYFQYYRPFGAARAAPPDYSAAGIAPVPTPAADDFQDTPELSRAVANSAGGVAVLDQAHDNQFALEELTMLDSLLASRGYEVTPFTDGDLAAALRPAGALVVVAPVSHYTAEEALAVREFVARGGRLLLVGDPTRYNIEFDEFDIFAPPVIRTAQVPLNDLANAFDITFRGDYLYNVTESEGNFRNILLDEADFATDPLTDGLEQLAFYSSHSLQTGPAAAPLIMGDDNTWSSATDRPGGLTLAAVSPAEEGDGGRVLALGDLHFLLEPYNAVYDNGAFVARVADFLTAGGESAAGLASFPRFLHGPVDLAYSGGPELGPDAFDEVVALQGALRAVGLPLSLTAEPDPAHDAILLGLYNQADDVADLLERAGVELVISPAIQPPAEEEAEADQTAAEATGTRVIESPLGTLQMSGTALILLDTDGDRQQVVALAASNDGLESAAHRLRADGGVDLTDCLLQGDLAVCPTGIANEAVEYELVTSGPGETNEEPDAGADEPERPQDGGASSIDAIDQGAIALDETKSGELAAEEADAWTFSGGPATIDIVVAGSEDIDVVLELYNPDQELMGNVDSTFAGGTEEMLGIEIPDDGDYTIRIRDFFNDGGSYELTVTAGEPGGSDESASAGNRVFIFADDDGEPLGEGFTSAAIFVELLADAYDVTTWTATVDGPLSEDTLRDYDLLIWDSGTYRDVDGLLGQDTGAIIAYLDGGGDIFVTGSSPTILGDVELAPLASVAIAATPDLTDSFEDGDVLDLDGAYEVALPNVGRPAANESIFLVRPPEEEGAGEAVAVAGQESTLTEQKTIFLFVPFAALPDDARGLLLENIMAWFGA